MNVERIELSKSSAEYTQRFTVDRNLAMADPQLKYLDRMI
jgi:hypothetical protein